MDDYRYSPYPFWEMLAIWIGLGGVGLGLALIKALPAIITAMIIGAPVFTLCAVVLMMTGTAMILALRNNDARYWFLPIFPIVAILNGGHNLVNFLRGAEAVSYFSVFGPDELADRIGE